MVSVLGAAVAVVSLLLVVMGSVMVTHCSSFGSISSSCGTIGESIQGTICGIGVSIVCIGLRRGCNSGSISGSTGTIGGNIGNSIGAIVVIFVVVLVLR